MVPKDDNQEELLLGLVDEFEKAFDAVQQKSEAAPSLENLDEQRQLSDLSDKAQLRKLRGEWAEKWFWVIVGQLMITHYAFMYHLLVHPVDPITLRIFLSTTLVETFGVILIITRWIFKPADKQENTPPKT